MSGRGVGTRSARLVATTLALAALGAGPAPPARPELVGNGSFAQGAAGWETEAGADANRAAVAPSMVDRLNPMGQLVVAPGATRRGARPRLVHRNQGLTRLEPNTEYVVSFRARASSPRRLFVTLGRAGTTRPAGLDATVRLGAGFESYDLEFRTPPDLGRGERWLALVADTTAGETWIDDVSLRRTPVYLVTSGSAPAALPAFDSPAWTSSIPDRIAGTRRIVEVPANGMALVSLEQPVPLPDAPWDLELHLATDTPERLGRVSLMARSGEDAALDHAMISTSGLARGAQVVRFPRERFFQHWYSGLRWRDVRTLAIRIEATGAGPLAIALERLVVAPRRPGVPLPPIVVYAGVEQVTPRAAVLEVETDRPTTIEVRHGPTAAYGRRVVRTETARRHRVAVAGLEPGMRHHVRAFVRDGATSASTGDLVFRAAPELPPLASAGGARAAGGFTVGLIGVAQIEDLARAAGNPFDVVQSYQLAATGNTEAHARRYLDAAGAAGLRALAGFDPDRIVASDVEYARRRVRALRDHPALGGWSLFDEPELHETLSREALRAAYETIRAEDRAHSVHVGASRIPRDYPHRGAFDLAVLGRYPVPYARPGHILKSLEEAQGSGIPFAYSFQAYATDLDHRWPTQGLGPGRFPSAAEMRAMAFLAVNHGARALWAFSFDYLHFTPGAAWKWVELCDLARELRSFAPLWSSAARPARSIGPGTSAELDVAVRAHAGQDYVVAVNLRDHPVNATIRLRGAPFRGVKRVDALAVEAGVGGRARAGAISDRWESNAVHVYRVVGED